jgi:glutamine synthetase
MNSHQEYALKVITDQDIHFVQLWFVGLNGQLKMISISPINLEDIFENGMIFDANALFGHSKKDDYEMYLRPYAETFLVLPWRNSVTVNGNHKIGGSKQSPVARIFCGIVDSDGHHSVFDCRNIMKKAHDFAIENGIHVLLRPEIEFYLFKNDYEFSPIDNGGYFDIIPTSEGQNFRRDVITLLEEIGIDVDYSNHSNCPGQNRIALKSSCALETADNIITARTIIREIANQYGLTPSFMPKPSIEHSASGLNTYISLFQTSDSDHGEDELPILYDESGSYNLSGVAKFFMHGISKYATSFIALTNQSVNSYKRLTIDSNTPSTTDNGSDSSGILKYQNLKASSSDRLEIEYRLLDSISNPYLSYATLIYSGIEGIIKQLPRDENVQKLPTSLESALNNLINVDLNESILGSVLGESFVDSYNKLKRHDVKRYNHQITPAECV